LTSILKQFETISRQTIATWQSFCNFSFCPHMPRRDISL